jgi:hypothetical protein
MVPWYSDYQCDVVPVGLVIVWLIRAASGFPCPLPVLIASEPEWLNLLSREAD